MEEERFVVDLDALQAPRRSGVSGIMRLRNEAEFLDQVISSHFALDELIIVYNECRDETPAIAETWAARDPKRIKVYAYEPFVHPPGSREFDVLPANSPNSLANYSNYALVRSTCRWVVKVDGDHIALPMFTLICEALRQGVTDAYYTFQGINLWDEGGLIYVNGNRALTGGGDIGFFPATTDTHFVKQGPVEALQHALPRRRVAPPLFYHLKGMKRDRGLSHYAFADNPSSALRTMITEWYERPELLPADDYLALHFPDVPLPRDMGIEARPTADTTGLASAPTLTRK